MSVPDAYFLLGLISGVGITIATRLVIDAIVGK